MARKAAVYLSNEQPLQAIDLARTFCIYLVVQKHLVLSALVQKPASPWVTWFFLRLGENGIYGVYLFFVISGFLITRLADRMPGGLFGFSLKAFYVRRAARILPLFLLAAFLGFLFWVYSRLGVIPSVYCFNLPPVSDPIFWLSFFSFSFNWYCVLHPEVYFSLGFHWILLWSLSVEEQFYLFYPLILLALRNVGKLIWFLSALILLGPLFRLAGAMLWPHRTLPTSISTPAVWDLLAAGALVYLLSKKLKPFLDERRKLAVGLCLGGFFVLMLVCLLASADDLTDQIWAPTFLALGLGLFLLGAFSLSGFQNKLLGFVSLPGRWSYGIYLLHIMVLFTLWFFLKGRTFLECGLVYGAALVAVAGISHHFYETPMNHWVRQWAGGGSKAIKKKWKIPGELKG
jgi:peptidoglycan/LPS O-acetylase OafA/YrhL